MQQQSSGKAKNVIISGQSRVVFNPNSQDGGEVTEVAAQVSIPTDGGWGWVVVFATFFSIFILDGVSYTFGSLREDMMDDMQESDTLIALVNSIAVALYLLTGPIVSAFINRFGFRACIMFGSAVVSLSFFVSYFAATYGPLIVFYGVFAGCGYSFINLSASLVVGFYFEKMRSFAISLATSGSSIGVMVMSSVNIYFVKLAGWRATTLFHSGLFGLIYFVGMAYRPLLTVTVAQSGEPTRTNAYLPSLSQVGLIKAVSHQGSIAPTITERMFNAVSNVNYPTAAAVVQPTEKTSSNLSQAGPSSAPAVSKLTITNVSSRPLTEQQIKQVKSMMSRGTVQDKCNQVELTIQLQKPSRKKSFWRRLFSWEPHIEEARPMYRDDIFYDGKLESLPIYKKSMVESPVSKSGLEYKLAVTRAVATDDLREKRGVFTTAVRRVLATVMDTNVLRMNSYKMLCLSGSLTYLGFLVPYVYLQDRNLKAGVDPKHCDLFVSVIGLANTIGRLTLGCLALKINPMKLYIISCFGSGLSTMLSHLSFTYYYQYMYCCVFGFFIASLASLRCLIFVHYYGLEKLTNATGMMSLFLGIGSLIGTPMASIIQTNLGYGVSFQVAGFFMTLGGVVLLPINYIVNIEKKNNMNSAKT